MHTFMQNTRQLPERYSTEGLYFEAKSASNGIPPEFWESYSAFANTYGGTILLGVDEHKEEIDPQKRYTVTSISNPQKLITDFWNLINVWLVHWWSWRSLWCGKLGRNRYPDFYR